MCPTSLHYISSIPVRERSEGTDLVAGLGLALLRAVAGDVSLLGALGPSATARANSATHVVAGGGSRLGARRGEVAGWRGERARNERGREEGRKAEQSVPVLRLQIRGKRIGIDKRDKRLRKASSSGILSRPSPGAHFFPFFRTGRGTTGARVGGRRTGSAVVASSSGVHCRELGEEERCGEIFETRFGDGSAAGSPRGRRNGLLGSGQGPGGRMRVPDDAEVT